ncbi:DUF6342 family protein [Streptomyces sp. NPDC058632]|uniref:DUF6342 family protein n=1 Tax=unclassified Streptomyces TaxID=2593676 RepID=UPI003669E872
MPDVDLGVASDWDEGDTHGRIGLRPSPKFSDAGKQDVVISSPLGIELSVNTNLSTSQEGDRIVFTTHHGTEKKIIAILDSDGDLYIAGRVIQEQGDLSY